jgi:hypothetical protein
MRRRQTVGRYFCPRSVKYTKVDGFREFSNDFTYSAQPIDFLVRLPVKYVQ